VDEGPARVRELGALGAAFDRDPDGVLELTREGGHLHGRIVHAGGDATGAEVERALIAAVVAAGDIEVMEHALALDLLLDEAGAHPLGDLAPRDVVAKQMSRSMAAQGVDHLFLDARGLGADLLRRRFPTLLANCAEIGVDPIVEPVPVAPAAHYASGGVRTDVHGRTSVAGLYACGEVACTGVHGANRLASNSLLEGLVC